MSRPKLLCDENFNYEVTLALRRAGWDVLHVCEAIERLGDSDKAQLAFAIEQNRAILTHDREDFEVLHKNYMVNGWEHCGIVICTPYEVGLLTRQIIRILGDKPEVLSNALWHL